MCSFYSIQVAFCHRPKLKGLFTVWWSFRWRGVSLDWIQVRLSCCLVPRLQWADDNERGGIQGMWQGVCTDERFLQFTSFSLWEWRNKMIRQSLIIIRELLILTLSIFITLLGCISWYHWQQGWYQIILSTGTISSNTQYTPRECIGKYWHRNSIFWYKP